MLGWVVAVLAASPLVGAEVSLDPNPGRGPAWSNQDRPRVATAFGSQMSLVVWRDYRAGNAEIYAARIDPSGSLIEPDGIRLTQTHGDEGPPAVAQAGSSFIVTWHAEGRIVAKRVTTTGAVLDSTAVTIAGGATPKTNPAVACNQTSCRFVWVEQAAVPNLGTRTTAVDLSGATPDVAVAATTTSPQSEPQIAVNPTNFLIAWTESGATAGIHAARFDAAGVALDPGGVSIALGLKSRPHVASNAASSTSKTMIAWLNNDSAVGATWVLNSGALMSGPVAGPLLPAPVVDLDVTYSGADFQVVAARQDGSLIEGRTVTDALDAQGPLMAIVSSSNALRQPSIVTNPTGSLLAFQWQVLGPRHVFVQRVSYGLTPFGPQLCVSRGAASQDEPRVAFDGTRFVAAWNEARDFTSYFPGTFATRVELDGGVGASFQVSAANRNVCEVAAKNGNTQVVFWDEGSTMRLEGNRLSAVIAAPLDGLGAPLVPSGFSPYPGLAWGNGRALVAYAITNALGLAFVTPDGDAGIIPSVPVVSVDSPKVASNGNDFLVVWLGRNASFEANVYGLRVAASGALIDAQPFVIAAPPGAARPGSVRVAFNGTEYLAVWNDDRAGSADIYGARIFVDGGTPDSPLGIGVVATPGDQVRADVVWEGTQWLVAWTHLPDSGMPDVDGRLVSSSLLDRGQIVRIAQSGDLEQAPHLASNGAGRSLVVYQRFDPAVANSRVKARRLLSLPVGVPCASNEQCAGGFCTDGVCCNVACGGTDLSDCRECASNGQCSTLTSAYVCRPAANACDVAESCAGAMTCPADVTVSAGCDAGTPDAGPSDGGGAADGGSDTDAGEEVDAGAEQRVLSVGCGCAAGSGSSLGWLAFTFVLIAGGRSRRDPFAFSSGARKTETAHRSGSVS